MSCEQMSVRCVCLEVWLGCVGLVCLGDSTSRCRGWESRGPGREAVMGNKEGRGTEALMQVQRHSRVYDFLGSYKRAKWKWDNE